jgi:hypothetical protein
MKLDLYVENLRREFLRAAEARGESAHRLAEGLVATLDASVRLTLLGVLSDAVDEITGELAPGVIEIRLLGLDPAFVVTPPAALDDEADDAVPDAVPVPEDGSDGDGATARINFRPSTRLKGRIDDAAGREGLSVNAWLARVATAALDADARRAVRRTPPDGNRRFSGWVR